MDRLDGVRAGRRRVAVRPGPSVVDAISGRSDRRPAERSVRHRLQRGSRRVRAEIVVAHAARRQACHRRCTGVGHRRCQAREPGPCAGRPSWRPRVRSNRNRRSQRVVGRGRPCPGLECAAHHAHRLTACHHVGRLHVVNLDATVSTASSLRLMVQGLSASLLGDAQGRLVGEIHADRGIRLEADSVAGMLDRVTANVTIGSETLFIRSLVAESSSGDVRLDGAVMFGESGGYDLKYFSRIDMSELRKWWDRSPPARGRVEFSGSIAGALTDPRLTFDVRARDFALGALSDARLDATGHASVDSIVIDTCVLRSVEGVFNGRGRIALGDGDGQSRLAGEWSLPRLRALASRLDLDPSRWPALPVSGSVNLSWPGPTPAIATVAGDLHANLRRPGEGSLTIAGKAGRWTLQYSHAFAGETVADFRLATVLNGAEFRRSSCTDLSTSVHATSLLSFGSFASRQLRYPHVWTLCGPDMSQPAELLPGRSARPSWISSSLQAMCRPAMWMPSRSQQRCARTELK